MEKTNRLFRKAAFGGFQKEDVMQYIETMKTEFFDYKAQVEETIRELNEKLEAFEQGSGAPADVPAAPAQSGETALSINQATEHLKQVADELCDKMNRLLGRMQSEQAPAPAEPAAPETAQDKVQQLLTHLFDTPKSETPVAPAAPTFGLDDVFPAYLK